MTILIRASRALIAKTKIVISNLIYGYRVKQWIKDKGDEELRINYKLNKNSIVFDVGGYLGDWSDAIYNKYRCRIFVFEPVKEYFHKITQRLRKISKIQVYNFGLGEKDIRKSIYKMDNSSSFYKKDSYTEKEICKIRDIKKFIIKNNLKKINLIKINIEGGEYDLLDKMIDSNLIHMFENLQIQFHRFMPNAKLRRKEIQNKLVKTHYLTYNYSFIWENWKKKQ